MLEPVSLVSGGLNFGGVSGKWYMAQSMVIPQTLGPLSGLHLSLFCAAFQALSLRYTIQATNAVSTCP